MKLTGIEVYYLLDTLQKLSNEKMNVRTAYVINKNKKALANELATLEELAKEHRNEDGTIKDNDKFNEVYSIEVDVELKLLDINDLNFDIEPSSLEVLEKIIKED